MRMGLMAPLFACRCKHPIRCDNASFTLCTVSAKCGHVSAHALKTGCSNLETDSKQAQDVACHPTCSMIDSDELSRRGVVLLMSAMGLTEAACISALRSVST